MAYLNCINLTRLLYRHLSFPAILAKLTEDPVFKQAGTVQDLMRCDISVFRLQLKLKNNVQLAQSNTRVITRLIWHDEGFQKYIYFKI